ncbi:MAG: serine/threonine-protein kinase [Polyangiaceae bacterium]
MRDPVNRRAAWRSSLARIASACEGDEASPLEGLAPAKLVDSIKVALSSGLIDDLDFLSPPSAGSALYEIAAALPTGPEKREVGRRVSTRLIEGDAATFTAMVIRMAHASGKGLSGDAVRSRIALVCAAPPSTGVRADNLAFALLSRRELAREWVGANATGSLPDRRLSAQLLEHGARAMSRRASHGDEQAMRLLRSESVSMAFGRLLRDREPLVWRHIAVARGILAAYHPAMLQEMEHGLAPSMTPTEWRRSAASLAAFASYRPDLALKRLRDALTRGFLARDPGAAPAFLWGAAAAAELEPEAAEQIVEMVVDEAPAEALEALPEVLAVVGTPKFGERAVTNIHMHLGRPSMAQMDEKSLFQLTTRSQLLLELQPIGDREATLSELLRDAQKQYVEQGARQAYRAGVAALERLMGSIDALEALDASSARFDDAGRTIPPPASRPQGGLERRAAYLVLRELDAGLASDSTLRDVLMLGHRLPEAQRALESLDDVYDRITGWIVTREEAALGPNSRSDGARIQRLRTLLHLADARTLSEGDESSPAARARARCLRVGTLMLQMLASGAPLALHRTICATLARALDALLRDETLDPCDVVLLVAQRNLGIDQVDTLSEASMSPDLGPLFAAYGALVRTAPPPASSAISSGDYGSDGAPSAMPASMLISADEDVTLATARSREDISAAALHSPHQLKRVQAIASFARNIDPDASSRTETLQTVLQRLARSLVRVLGAPSLGALCARGEQEVPPLVQIERSCETLAHLVAGARQRFGEKSVSELTPSSTLSATVASSVQQGDSSALEFALGSSTTEIAIALPSVFADVVNNSLTRLSTLPVSTPAPVASSSDEAELPLPGWVPRRRSLGGFYVVRALGAGAGGTIFVVRRIEDRNDANAERFALKVPDYDGNAARSLSEQEFHQLFRAEASALLGLPHHPNLARFVTFDLAARPKPILVMELVEGLSLERYIHSGQSSLNPTRLFALLDGVLAGLEAMHGAGVGHLDLKPANIILRDQSGEPVLVDFGLSGRNIRPGCGTVYYGAPEIWGLVPDGHSPTPAPVDVYAFACVVYELLTAKMLFDAPTEMGVIAAHLNHDGWPPGLMSLAENPNLRPLVNMMSAALRRDPRDRITVPILRRRLQGLNAGLAQTMKRN